MEIIDVATEMRTSVSFVLCAFLLFTFGSGHSLSKYTEIDLRNEPETAETAGVNDWDENDVFKAIMSFVWKTKWITLVC